MGNCQYLMEVNVCFRTQTISIHTSWLLVILFLFYPNLKLNPLQSQNAQVLPTSVGEEDTSATIQTSKCTEGHLVMDKNHVFSCRSWIINVDEIALFDSESCVVCNAFFTLLLGKLTMHWSNLLRSYCDWCDFYLAPDHYASSLIQYPTHGMIFNTCVYIYDLICIYTYILYFFPADSWAQIWWTWELPSLKVFGWVRIFSHQRWWILLQPR